MSVIHIKTHLKKQKKCKQTKDGTPCEAEKVMEMSSVHSRFLPENNGNDIINDNYIMKIETLQIWSILLSFDTEKKSGNGESGDFSVATLAKREFISKHTESSFFFCGP